MGDKNFLQTIYQMEMDQVSYLLKTYLRVRLSKVTHLTIADSIKCSLDCEVAQIQPDVVSNRAVVCEKVCQKQI